MLAELLKAAQTEVDNHSIYVWGGSGRQKPIRQEASMYIDTETIIKTASVLTALGVIVGVISADHRI